MNASSRLAPAPERGALTIDPTVVEKIAAQAAAEVDGVGGAARRMLSVPLGSDENAERPRIDAHVDGTTVTATVRCSIAYPAPVARTTEELRVHLMERIDSLTGLHTRQVDITVAALTSAAPRPRRELA